MRNSWQGQPCRICNRRVSIRPPVHKKTGAVERSQAFHHAGLLFNEPLGVGLFRLGRAALYLVIRRLNNYFFGKVVCVRERLPTPSDSIVRSRAIRYL